MQPFPLFLGLVSWTGFRLIISTTTTITIIIITVVVFSWRLTAASRANVVFFSTAFLTKSPSERKTCCPSLHRYISSVAVAQSLIHIVSGRAWIQLKLTYSGYESATTSCPCLTDLDNHRCPRPQNCTIRCRSLKQWHTLL